MGDIRGVMSGRMRAEYWNTVNREQEARLRAAWIGEHGPELVHFSEHSVFQSWMIEQATVPPKPVYQFHWPSAIFVAVGNGLLAYTVIAYIIALVWPQY